MIQHTAPISGISTFRDNWIATAGYDNQVILWDAMRGVSVGRIVHDHLANQCTFSQCGSLLASASSDGTARLYTVPDLKLKAVLGSHEDDVEMVTFHPTLALVATASRDHRVRIFDTDGHLLATFRGHTEDVLSVDWVQNSMELVSSSDDGTIKRWDLQTKSLIEDIDFGEVQTDTLVFGDNGIVFAGNDNGEIVTLVGGSKRVTDAHRAGIKRLAFQREYRLLASMSYDRHLKIWSVQESGDITLRAVANLPSVIWPRSCAFQGPDTLVFGTFGTTYASYNFVSNKWSVEKVLPTYGRNAVAVHGKDIYAVGDAGVVFRNGEKHKDLGSLCNFLTPFGNVLLTGGQLGIVFDAISGKAIHQHRSPLNCAATFTRDGQEYAVVGTYTGEGLIFTRKHGEIRIEKVIPLHSNAIKGVACSDTVLFSVCATGAAAYHRLSDYGLEREIPKAHEKIANGCASLGNNVFASVSRDLRLRIWEDLVAETIATPHTHSIKCVAASRDGLLIATGGYDGTVAIYNRKTRSWKHSRPTASGISSLTVASNGVAFLASSYDGKIYEVDSW